MNEEVEIHIAKITDVFCEKMLTIIYDKICLIPFRFYANNSPFYSKLTISKQNNNIVKSMKEHPGILV